MTEINEAKARAAMNRSRLVVISEQAVNETALPKIDLNQQLSEQLLEIPLGDRSRSVPRLIEELINKAKSDEVVITGLEILFDRSLSVDPMRLLAACSKNKTLLVCWPGDKSTTGLSYAIPSHPEYRIYKASDLSDVIYLDTDAHGH